MPCGRPLVRGVADRGRGLAFAWSSAIGRLPKRLFLWVLERESNTRRRDVGERNLPFAQVTMAVILGVVIQGAATSLSRQSFLTNYRAVLLITALLLFVEMYIVLLRYHERLSLPYVNLYMFGDLGISILFVTCVTLIANSWDNQEELDTALQVLALLFMTLLIRQVVAFVDLILQSRDVETISQYESLDDRLRAINLDLILRNEDLQSKLTKIHLIQWGIFVPMIADLIGTGYVLCALLVFNITWWSWVGLIGFLIYELIMFGLFVGATKSVRRIQASMGIRTSADRPEQSSS
jgi:Co/Zn/Cd efflux system component